MCIYHYVYTICREVVSFLFFEVYYVWSVFFNTHCTNCTRLPVQAEFKEDFNHDCNEDDTENPLYFHIVTRREL